MTGKSAQDFEIFTSLRYDPILLDSEVNSSSELSFSSPSPFYMLSYHRDRMLEAARYFDFDAAADTLVDGRTLEHQLRAEVEQFKQKEGIKVDKPLKVRIEIDRAGIIKSIITPAVPVPLSYLYPDSLDPPEHAADTPAKSFRPSPRTGGALVAGSEEGVVPIWAVALDNQAVDPSPFTAVKTTNRTVYNDARERSMPEEIGPVKGTAEVILFSKSGEVMEGSMTSPYFFRDGRWVTPPVHTDGSIGQGSGSGGQRGTSRRWALQKGLCVEEVVKTDSLAVGEGLWISNGVMGFQYARLVNLGTD